MAWDSFTGVDAEEGGRAVWLETEKLRRGAEGSADLTGKRRGWLELGCSQSKFEVVDCVVRVASPD